MDDFPDHPTAARILSWLEGPADGVDPVRSLGEAYTALWRRVDEEPALPDELRGDIVRALIEAERLVAQMLPPHFELARLHVGADAAIGQLIGWSKPDAVDPQADAISRLHCCMIGSELLSLWAWRERERVVTLQSATGAPGAGVALH